MSGLLNTDLAYAAGLLDGEGSISIIMAYKKRRTPHHTLCMTVVNTDPRPIRWLLERFSGRMYSRMPGQARRTKTLYDWHISARKAEAFLRAVYPYLIIKREQADIAFALRRTYQGPHSVLQRYSPIRDAENRKYVRSGVVRIVDNAVLAERERLRQSLKQLRTVEIPHTA